MAQRIGAASFIAGSALAALAGCATPDYHAVTTETQDTTGTAATVILPLNQFDSTRATGNFGKSSVYVVFSPAGVGLFSAKIDTGMASSDYIYGAVVLPKDKPPVLSAITVIPTSLTSDKDFSRQFMNMQDAASIANSEFATDNDRRMLRELAVMPAQITSLVNAAVANYNNLPKTPPTTTQDVRAICSDSSGVNEVSANTPFGYARGYTTTYNNQGDVYFYTNNYAAHASVAGSGEIRFSLSSFKRDEINGIHINTPTEQIDEVGGRMLVTPMTGNATGVQFPRDYKPGTGDRVSDIVAQARDVANQITFKTSGSGCGRSGFNSLTSTLGVPDTKAWLTGQASVKAWMNSSKTFDAPPSTPNSYLYNNLSISAPRY